MIEAPRIHGEFGQYSMKSRYSGQWFFTVRVSFMGEKQEYGPFGPWTSESIAKKEMKKCSQLFSNELKKVPAGIPVPSIFPEKISVPIFNLKDKKPKKPKKKKKRKEKRRGGTERPILDVGPP